jgi:hypothetical protein
VCVAHAPFDGEADLEEAIVREDENEDASHDDGAVGVEQKGRPAAVVVELCGGVVGWSDIGPIACVPSIASSKRRRASAPTCR